MTTSTCGTVSAEEIKRYTEQMAHELGLTDLLNVESWAQPSTQSVAIPERITSFRNGQIRLRGDKNRS
ncbi:MAG: hypothetical protein ACXVP5_06595 [Tumebacillaceae bacterium]